MGTYTLKTEDYDNGEEAMHLNIDATVMAHAVFLHVRRRRALRWVMVSCIALILVCCAILWMYVRFTPIMGILLVAVAMIAAMMSPLQERFIRWTLRRQYRQMAARGDDVSQVSVTYDDKALRFDTPKTSASVDWSSFTEWYERDGLLLLYRTSQYFHVLPLDQMPSGDREAIYAHLREHLTQKE